MSTISKEHCDRLFWLGRYTERFFITLRSLDKLYDKMIDNKFGYREYLAYFSLPDTYKDSPDFFTAFYTISIIQIPQRTALKEPMTTVLFCVRRYLQKRFLFCKWQRIRLYPTW